MSKKNDKSKTKKVKSTAGAPLVTVDVSIKYTTFSGPHCTITGRSGGFLHIQHKRPRSATILNRSIPVEDLVYAYGSEGIAGAEVCFRHTNSLFRADATVMSQDGALTIFEDEDGQQMIVNRNSGYIELDLSAEATVEKKAKKSKSSKDEDEAPAKKKKKVKVDEKPAKKKRKFVE